MILKLDLAAHSLTIDNQIIALTPKEFELLSFLASRPGIAFTPDQLLNHVWGYDYFGDARTVDTHIRSLRITLNMPFAHYNRLGNRIPFRLRRQQMKHIGMKLFDLSA